VTGGEFVRRVERLGIERSINVKFVPRRGKGSHGMLYFGTCRTTVCNLKKELKSGTYFGMLKQLGIKQEDING
jgi:hypothetical protein